MRHLQSLPDFFRNAGCAGDPRPAAWTATDIVRGPRAWSTPENLRARGVCSACQIQIRCLDWAHLEEQELETEMDVILGGMDPLQRRAMRETTSNHDTMMV